MGRGSGPESDFGEARLSARPGSALAGPNHAARPAGSPAPAAWWVQAHDSKVYGPYDLRALRTYVAERRISPHNLVCAVAGTAWVPLQQLLALGDAPSAAVAGAAGLALGSDPLGAIAAVRQGVSDWAKRQDTPDELVSLDLTGDGEPDVAILDTNGNGIVDDADEVISGDAAAEASEGSGDLVDEIIDWFS